MPEARSMSWLPSTSTSSAPSAWSTNTGRTTPKPRATARSRAACSSRERGPGTSVSRSRSVGRSVVVSTLMRASCVASGRPGRSRTAGVRRQARRPRGLEALYASSNRRCRDQPIRPARSEPRRASPRRPSPCAGCWPGPTSPCARSTSPTPTPPWRGRTPSSSTTPPPGCAVHGMVLTTGLRLPRSRRRTGGVRGPAGRPPARGRWASAPGCRFASVPAGVVDACRTQALPLVEVPLATPFLAVVQAVAERLGEQRRLRLQESLTAQRQLTRAALRGGTPAVVRSLARVLGSGVLVVDADLVALGRSGTPAVRDGGRRRGDRVPGWCDERRPSPRRRGGTAPGRPSRPGLGVARPPPHDAGHRHRPARAQPCRVDPQPRAGPGRHATARGRGGVGPAARPGQGGGCAGVRAGRPRDPGRRAGRAGRAPAPSSPTCSPHTWAGFGGRLRCSRPSGRGPAAPDSCSCCAATPPCHPARGCRPVSAGRRGLGPGSRRPWTRPFAPPPRPGPATWCAPPSCPWTGCWPTPPSPARSTGLPARG